MIQLNHFDCKRRNVHFFFSFLFRLLVSFHQQHFSLNAFFYSFMRNNDKCAKHECILTHEFIFHFIEMKFVFFFTFFLLIFI